MEKIKVYKTDVKDPSKADTMLDEIRRELPGSDPSFDLDDCDKVLRIEWTARNAVGDKLKPIFKRFGNHFEPLP